MGSIVAREVLERLPETNEDETCVARALCIGLAEEKMSGKKFDPSARLKLLIHALQHERLNVQYQQANRQLMQAKLAGDAELERKAYEELVTLRREMSPLKSNTVNPFTKQRGN
jgi:hypothetical protein